MPAIENLHFYFYVFSGLGTYRGPKPVLKAVFKKKLYIYSSNIFWGVSVSFEKTKKMDFAILCTRVPGFINRLGVAGAVL